MATGPGKSGADDSVLVSLPQRPQRPQRLRLRCRKTLHSTWRLVQRKSAADVASQFFKLGFLGAQDTQDGALRGAKLSVINRGGFASHPAFWAPFVLIGDGRRSLSSGATAHASPLNPLLLSEKK